MDSPESSLVSSQEAASRRLPNGCGRELNGLSLHKEEGTASDVRHQPHRAMRGIPPSIPEGTRGAHKLQGDYVHVHKEGANNRKSPRTAATYQNHAHERIPPHTAATYQDHGHEQRYQHRPRYQRKTRTAEQLCDESFAPPEYHSTSIPTAPAAR